MTHSNGKITGPVNFTDVNATLGTSHTDEHALCTDALINKCAKCKPVRYGTQQVITAAQRQSTRYGFGPTVPSFYGGTQNPSVTWEYLKPRVDTEYARIADFDGYFHRAYAPFYFDISGSLGNIFGLYMTKDNTAIQMHRDAGIGCEWDADGSMSLADCLTNSTNASGDSYVALAIHDITQGDSVVVVINLKAKNISTSVSIIQLYPTQQTISGVTYPAISMLNDTTRNGHTFRFIVGLTNYEPSNPYQVFTTPNMVTMYSLAIVDGVDRREKVIGNSTSITGLKSTISKTSGSLVYVDQVTKYGQTMLRYRLNGVFAGQFITPSVNWSPQGGRVYVNINFTANGYVGDDYSLVVNTSVQIPNAGTTYNIANLCTITDVYVYFFNGVPVSERKVFVSATAKSSSENVPFENTLTITV